MKGRGMNNFICIGRVLKPQALKGEVKIAVNTRDISGYLSYKYLYLGQEHKKFAVEKCRIQDGFVVAKLKDVDGANVAEKLRNEDVYIDDSQLVDLPEDEFYVQDLIGIDVFSTNGETYLGHITAIDNFSSADIVTIEKDGKEILFPFLANVVNIVDVENKKMFVDVQRFKEVCVDED